MGDHLVTLRDLDEIMHAYRADTGDDDVTLVRSLSGRFYLASGELELVGHDKRSTFEAISYRLSRLHRH